MFRPTNRNQFPYIEQLGIPNQPVARKRKLSRGALKKVFRESEERGQLTQTGGMFSFSMPQLIGEYKRERRNISSWLHLLPALERQQALQDYARQRLDWLKNTGPLAGYVPNFGQFQQSGMEDAIKQQPADWLPKGVDDVITQTPKTLLNLVNQQSANGQDATEMLKKLIEILGLA